MFVSSLANGLGDGGPSCPFLQYKGNHLKILLFGPLLFIDQGIDMIEPSVPAAFPAFEVPSLRLNEHLIADFLPLVLVLSSFGNPSQEFNLLRTPDGVLFTKC